MTISLRTGNTGKAVTSAADGRLYASLCGAGSYVTQIGNRCSAALDGPNKLVVQGGCILHNGRFIDLEGVTEWTIPSGIQAQKRSNLCVVRTSIEPDGKESSFAVTLTGEATSDGEPEDPEYNTSSLLDGATVSDFPLYRVVTDGINAQEPVALFEAMTGSVSCPWPVGAVLNMVNDTDPNSIYPGTMWQKMEGRFLLGSSSSHALGETDGEEEHTLTVAEMPSHDHYGVVDYNDNWKGNISGGSNVSGMFDAWQSTGKAGGGQAHNNMPPYEVVNMWKRVA